MTTSLILPEGTPEGARQLGIRNAPSLRLSIGFRNPERGNAPDKLDYFRAKEGANKEFAAAAAKFHRDPDAKDAQGNPNGGYGATPRAIDIRLPGRLEDAMRIEYLAFKGAKDDPLGGVMIARGQTNFVPLGYCGGPDTLTVWDEDGTVRHVQTKGVDAITKQPLDTVAAELGLMLCTTFCVGLPKILGFGSHAEITSKSLRSTDQVWAKLRALYAAFPNGTVTFATRPLLVVRPAQARPIIKTKDGKVGRRRVLIYVLDVVQPESEDEMIARLEQYHGAVAPGIAQRPVAEIEVAPGVVASPPENVVEEITDAEIVENSEPGVESIDESMLSPASGSEQDSGLDPTGTPLTTEQSGPEHSDEPKGFVERDEIPPLASGDSSQQVIGDTTPLPVAPGDVGPEPVLEEVTPEASAPADEITGEDRAAAEMAARVKPPFGAYQTKTLAVIVKNPTGKEWFEYAIKLSVAGGWTAKDAKFERALWAFTKVYLPDIYATYKESAK